MSGLSPKADSDAQATELIAQGCEPLVRCGWPERQRPWRLLLVNHPLPTSTGAVLGEMVMPDLEQSIRERAYHLWIESGCPDGNAEAHWLAAQREVLSASVSTFARVPEVKQPASLQPAALKRSTKSRKEKSK